MSPSTSGIVYIKEVWLQGDLSELPILWYGLRLQYLLLATIPTETTNSISTITSYVSGLQSAVYKSREPGSDTTTVSLCGQKNSSNQSASAFISHALIKPDCGHLCYVSSVISHILCISHGCKIVAYTLLLFYAVSNVRILTLCSHIIYICMLCPHGYVLSMWPDVVQSTAVVYWWHIKSMQPR